jgi:hypothetical protein
VAIAVRTCSAKNRAGQPCQAPVPGDAPTNHCLAHGDADYRESKGFGGVQPTAGRPRVPRPTEVLAERIEAEIDEWLGVLDTARKATKVSYVETNREGQETERIEQPDYTVQLAAFREAFDRAYGKPTQRTEQQHTGSFDVAAFFGVDPLQPTDSLPEEA